MADKGGSKRFSSAIFPCSLIFALLILLENPGIFVLISRKNIKSLVNLVRVNLAKN